MYRKLIVADFIVNAEKQVTDPPNNNKDFSWQRKMKEGQKGKPRKPGEVTPPGTFTKSPSEIARLLKMHSKDYGQAMSKMNSYINRNGKNLQGGDKSRLYDAKEHLKNNYGDQDKPKSTTALAEQPLYALPGGHNKDDGMVDLMGIVPDNREKSVEQDPQMKSIPKLNSVARLKASILNSEQDPGAPRMSSVENASSTEIDNLDETNVAPNVMADATFDSLDTKFEETHTPSNKAYAEAQVQAYVEAGSMLSIATSLLTADGEKWSGDVKTKKHPPEGLFKEGSGEAIAKWLKSSHGDLKGAMSSLNFYRNRAGKNLSPERKKALDSAEKSVRGRY